MQPLVSIIIPVYNLEGYMDACLRSVQAQTYPNWEAVCVDDGSRDGSYAVLCKLSQADARIRVLHQENAGVSAARNLGLQNANGEYITFLDGDDILFPNAVELWVQAMAGGAYDMVASSYQRIHDLDAVPLASSAECRAVSYPAFFGLDDLMARSVCFKLYRREALAAASFSTEYAFSEDTHFLYQVLANQIRIGYLPVPLYGYCEREKSATRDGFSRSHITAVLALRDVCDRLRDGDPFLQSMAIKMLLQEILLVRMHLAGDKEIARICRQNGNAYLRQWMRSRCFSFGTRLTYAVLFMCPHIYNFVRVCKDPTMLDYFRQQRRKKRGHA